MELDTVVNADCIKWLNEQPESFADLVFADPPFNIGYQYDVYEDKMAYDEYYAWTRDWMAGCVRALKPTGTFWVAIGDEYAAEIRMLGRELGLTLRNWVIWHYTFGQNTKRKFCRSHAHLFYFVRDPQVFTFNENAIRIFSDRQREYHDKRANPAGKLPNDTSAAADHTLVQQIRRHGLRPVLRQRDHAGGSQAPGPALPRHGDVAQLHPGHP